MGKARIIPDRRAKENTGLRYPAGALVFPGDMKNLFNRNAEDRGGPEGEKKRGDITIGLKGDDGLAGDAGPLGRFLLGHFAVVEPQPPNTVREFIHRRYRGDSCAARIRTMS